MLFSLRGFKKFKIKENTSSQLLYVCDSYFGGADTVHRWHFPLFVAYEGRNTMERILRHQQMADDCEM